MGLDRINLRDCGRGSKFQEEEDETKKKKRFKFFEPEYMFIFVDLISELNSSFLLSLLIFQFPVDRNLSP